METKSKDSGRIGQEIQVGERCPSCGESFILRDYEQNTLICGKCGRIIKEDIKDYGPEWRAYNQKEKDERKRGGPPIKESIHDKGLSTQIHWKNSDCKGKDLSPEQSSQMNRLRKWQKRSKMTSQRDRNLTIAFSEINRISSQLGLPKKVQEIASKIYRKAVDEDLIRGRSIELIVAAVVYIALRKTQLPRTLDEITEITSYEKREISRGYRSLSRELDIKLPPVNPVNFVARFGSNLGISGEVQSKAIELIEEAQEEKITGGKSPKGTAAAALYIASVVEGEKKSQREISDATGITEVTLRNRYKEMVEELDLDIEV